MTARGRLEALQLREPGRTGRPRVWGEAHGFLLSFLLPSTSPSHQHLQSVLLSFVYVCFYERSWFEHKTSCSPVSPDWTRLGRVVQTFRI